MRHRWDMLVKLSGMRQESKGDDRGQQNSRPAQAKLESRNGRRESSCRSLLSGKKSTVKYVFDNAESLRIGAREYE